MREVHGIFRIDYAMCTLDSVVGGGAIPAYVTVSSSSSIYQIPSTEHVAYRLVRSLVYKPQARGRIRETV